MEPGDAVVFPPVQGYLPDKRAGMKSPPTDQSGLRTRRTQSVEPPPAHLSVSGQDLLFRLWCCSVNVLSEVCNKNKYKVQFFKTHFNILNIN